MEEEWDAEAEEELQAIEAAYAAKRCHDNQLSNSGRRLPHWATIPSPSSSSSSDSTPQRNSEHRNGLWSLAPSPCQFNLKLRYQALNFQGRIVYCRTTSEVEQATLELLEKIEVMKQNTLPVALGFDIEWRPVFTRGEAQRRTAVMQICVDTADCYVMHIFHTGIPLVLKSLLEDAASVKVGVCIGNDAMKILQDFSVRVEPIEDLSGLANLKLGGVPKRWSLSSLTEMLICKQLAKSNKIRLGNWEADVLSRDQIRYAATDAYVSWYLHQVLNNFPIVKSVDDPKETVNCKMDKNQIVDSTSMC